MDILARMGTCERASIDECYLDLTAESRKRLAAAAGTLQHPDSFDRVHVCTENGPVSFLVTFVCSCARMDGLCCRACRAARGTLLSGSELFCPCKPGPSVYAAVVPVLAPEANLTELAVLSALEQWRQ